MKRVHKVMISLLAITSVITACSNDELADIKTYIKRVKERPSKKIEPLPVVKAPTSIKYDAQDLDNPFKAKAINVADDGNDAGLRPDQDREREPLEFYPLDSLEMVGTVAMNGKTWGIILSQDGTVFRIKEGNYIGNNHGKVISVDKKEIMVSELIPDGAGGWRKRESSVVLRE